MLDIRLRLATDNGTPGRVLETLSLSCTGYSGQTVKFTVSEKISGQLDAPFLVLVEYTTSKSGPWRRVPRNDLFIVDEDSADSVDASGAVSFTATAIIPWLAARYPLWWRPGDTAELERSYPGSTVGYILRDLIQSAQAVQNWGPHVTLGFSDPYDSAGQDWSEAIKQSWPLFTTTLGRVMQTLTEQGYMEWWAEGFQLKAVNAGTGADRSDTVTLGGPGFSRAPAKRKFDPATAIVVQYDLGWTHFDNPGADGRFGGLFKVMSQSGTPTRDAAEKNTQPALTEARAMQEELSYEWELTGDGVPVPWESFQVGDVVTARTRRGKKLLRVIGIDLSKDANGLVKATAVVGSKLLDLQARLAKRSAAASVGQVIGGSGSAVPPVAGPPKPAPLSPSALRVADNTGSWGDDGSERSTVKIAWDAVTQAVDGLTVDIDQYEIWSRRANEQMSLLTRTGTTLSASVTTWTPGEDRYVTVRARSRAGVWSPFTPEIVVVPARPSSIVPKPPTGLAVASNSGAFASDGSATATVRMTWAAVTQSTDALPMTVAAYRAELEDGQAWAELAETTGREATFTVPSGKARRVRIRARTRLGVWGDPSTPLSVTGANPTQTATAPSAPILATGMGLVAVAWDGKLAGGGSPPASFQLLYAETAPAASGPWARVGVPARSSGQVATVRGATGVVMFARLVWVDTLGRASTASAVSSIVAQGVGSGDLLDGSVTGQKLNVDEIWANEAWLNVMRAGVIETSMVTAGFAQNLDLAANGAISLIVNAQKSMQGELAQATGALEQTQAEAEAAANAAASAAAGVAVAQGQIAEVADAQAQTAAGLAQQQVYFRFDQDGAIIGRTDSPTAMHLKNTGMEIRESGVPVMWATAQQIHVPSLVTQTVVLSAHQIKKVGSRTVFQAL